MELTINVGCALVILTQMALELGFSRPRRWDLPAVARLAIRLTLAAGALGVIANLLYGTGGAALEEVLINAAVALVCVARFVRMSHLFAASCPHDWLPGGLSCGDGAAQPRTSGDAAARAGGEREAINRQADRLIASAKFGRQHDGQEL